MIHYGYSGENNNRHHASCSVLFMYYICAWIHEFLTTYYKMGIKTLFAAIEQYNWLHTQTNHDIKSGLNEFKNNFLKKNHVTFIDLILFTNFNLIFTIYWCLKFRKVPVTHTIYLFCYPCVPYEIPSSNSEHFADKSIPNFFAYVRSFKVKTADYNK